MAGNKAAERAAQIASTASPASSAKAAARRKAEAARNLRADWSPEELRMLEKAVVKFPQGTVKRWDQVPPSLEAMQMQDSAAGCETYLALCESAATCRDSKQPMNHAQQDL